MSSTFTAQNEINVKSLLIRALVLAETDLINAHKDAEGYEADLKGRVDLIKQLRSALAALGYDSKKSKGSKR